VVVIGGGLAGMAAAVALESAGKRVTLVEARKSLGGRAGSFEEPQSGEEIDNCQHVLLGCCTNLLDFYKRVRVEKEIHFERTVRFRDEEGRPHDLRAVKGVPAPLHLFPAFVKFGALPVRERIAVMMAMTAMMRMGRSGARALEGLAFGHWLDEHGQSESLVKRFYDPIIISALNEETRKCSAAYAIQVFQESLLGNREGYVVGVPAGTLAALYERLPIDDLRLGTRVAEMVGEGDRIVGVKVTSGQIVPADSVVLATNHHAARKLAPMEWVARDARFDHLEKLESVPILGAHLTFDRPVMRDPHAALISGPLQWLFRKDAKGRIVHGVISAARGWADRSKEQMLREFEAQIRSLFPEARDARLERGVIVIEKRATFAPTPGVDELRPGQGPVSGGLANLFLAGDYTLTGWPATMEGAVRSGYLAAEAVIGRGGILVGDLKTEWPARIAGL